MPTKGTINIEDFDHENSITNVWLNDIGVAGATYDTVTQDLDEIKDAIALLIKGEIRDAAVRKVFPESAAAVTDPDAQRERKWMVIMKDTTQFLDALNAVSNTGYNRLFRFEIATADLTGGKILASSDGHADLTEADWVTAVGSFEANVRSPWNNAPEVGVTPTQVVVDAYHVGKNI